jgi:mono/diheme cytochrome c family protein
MIPVVEGLWATNISLTLPGMSDAELETLLRTGNHPSRDELYLMPSKQTQFLNGRDMGALLAYLRTIPPKGDPTPPPPPGFKEAVGARLPDDYWRWKPGMARTYHTSAEEVAYFAANQAPPVGQGAELAQGRYIALTVCSACHGAALDGRGEDAGGIEAALLYDDAEYDRLLMTSTSRKGKLLKMEWGPAHEVPLTTSERSAVIAYTRSLAKARTQ